MERGRERERERKGGNRPLPVLVFLNKSLYAVQEALKHSKGHCALSLDKSFSFRTISESVWG
jgi:hypothetical protein